MANYNKKYSRRKKQYDKMTVPELRSILDKIEVDIKKTNEELIESKPKYTNYIEKREEYERLESEKKKIIGNAFENLSPIRKFFSEPEDPPLNKKDKDRVISINYELMKLEWVWNHIYIESGHHRLVERIEELKKRRTRVIKAIELVSARKSRKQKEKAIIAAYHGRSRVAANTIKRDIKQQIDNYPYCPYCEGELGDTPHCDHIHPVSHGGLSVTENMVYICATCNITKRDLTLREFIIKNHLSRDLIEQRLVSLGKRI